MDHKDFSDLVMARGHELYRDMPWRRDTSSYFILVSELMLQQTQVGRVIPKFEAFVRRFPSVAALANAPLSDVLRAWSGLGYNRRAKHLHQAAKQIVVEHGGVLPSDIEQLQGLPGIGPATAGAIMAYAHNQPIVYVETNIRTVYFYHFFDSGEKVSDSKLVPLIEATLTSQDPRTFYWALMDYGSWLKQREGKGRTSQSLSYKKQSKFSGSVRQIRGQIVASLGKGDMTREELSRKVTFDERFELALGGLIKDGLVEQTEGVYHLAK